MENESEPFFMWRKRKVYLKEAKEIIDEYPEVDHYVEANYQMRHHPEYGMDDNSIDLDDFWHRCEKLILTKSKNMIPKFNEYELLTSSEGYSSESKKDNYAGSGYAPLGIFRVTKILPNNEYIAESKLIRYNSPFIYFGKAKEGYETNGVYENALYLSTKTETDWYNKIGKYKEYKLLHHQIESLIGEDKGLWDKFNNIINN